MWYFAYGSNLNVGAVTDWCRHYARRAPAIKGGRGAVLDNYRLCFPIFSEYWGGGIADIAYDPGKYVAGAVFDLTEADLAILDQKVNRKLDSAAKEIGTYRRIVVHVTRVGQSEPIEAVTYQGVSTERYHIPPTRHYMDLLVHGAYTFGLSMMWIAHLKSFSTQIGRKPRAPGYGDAAARL